MFGDEGYTTLFRLRGMPVRLHWSFALGMLIFGGLRFVPGIWLGYFVLIAGHELGHGYLAQRYGHRVRSLDIHGFGGLCSYTGRPTALQRSVIAWGGVLAQLLFFGVARAVMWSLGPPTTAFYADLAYVFTRINLIIAALNLLPLNGFDGAQAWRLPKLWWRAWRGRSGAPASSDLAAGFRDKLRNRTPGDFAKDSPADSASVVRIERGPDGSVRVVAVESDEKDPADHP
jgi:Zn-dependent protease